MLQLAFAVCLGITLFCMGRFALGIAFIWFINWTASSLSKAECFYYPWQDRLQPEDPNYISQSSYWRTA